MDDLPSRRLALKGFGLAATGLAAAAAVVPAAGAAAEAGRSEAGVLAPPGATALRELTQRLARTPRRRDYRDVPMILDDPMLWDHEAISELLAYRAGPKQIWDNTDLNGSWIGGMHNSLNAQIWSFKHPDFLVVSATHGQAQIPLLDQAMWDKYQLAKLTGGTYAANTLIEPPSAAALADRSDESESGAYSAAVNNIAALMDRGVVFMACHIALWEMSGKLLKQGINPDKLSHGQVVAEMTNHLVPGVVLTPGMVATIPEFQQAGYHYIR